MSHSLPCPNQGRSCGSMSHFAGSKSYEECLRIFQGSSKSQVVGSSANQAPVPPLATSVEDLDAQALDNFDHYKEQAIKPSLHVDRHDRLSEKDLIKLLGGHYYSVDCSVVDEIRDDQMDEICSQIWYEVSSPEDSRSWDDVSFDTAIGDEITQWCWWNVEDNLLDDLIDNSFYPDCGHSLGEPSSNIQQIMDEMASEEKPSPKNLEKFARALLSEHFVYIGAPDDEERLMNKFIRQIQDIGQHGVSLEDAAAIWRFDSGYDFRNAMPNTNGTDKTISVDEPVLIMKALDPSTIDSSYDQWYQESIQAEGFAYLATIATAAWDEESYPPGDEGDYVRSTVDLGCEDFEPVRKSNVNVR